MKPPPASSFALLLAVICLGSGGGDGSRAGDGGFDPAPALAALADGDVNAALTAAREAAVRAGTSAAPHALAEKVEALAFQFYDQGHADATEALLLEALALRERRPGQQVEATAQLLHNLSGLVFNRGDLDSAEVYERRALELREGVAAADDPLLAQSRRDVGFILLSQGRLHESEPLLVESLETLERSNATDWLELAVTRDYVATLRRLQGRYAEAERMYTELVPDATERLGEDHPQVAFFVNNLAGVYRDEERYDRAETLLHRSLALRRAADPPDPGSIARATLNLAELYRLQGKLADAEPLYVEALALADEAYPEGSGERFEFVNQLAVLQRDRGRIDIAEPLARQALALAVGSLGPDHPAVAQSELDLADLLRARGLCPEAIEHDDRAVTIRERVFGPEHPEVAVARTARAACLAVDPARAREARDDLDRAIAILSATAAYPASAADALALRGRLQRPTEPAAARADLEAAIEAIEALRPQRGGGEGVRAEFLGSRAEIYERLARWEVEDGNIGRGLLVAERGRGRTLLDQLAAARVGDAEPVAPESAAAFAAARAEVGEYRARITFTETREDLTDVERAREMSRLSAELDRASRDFRAAYDRLRNASPTWRTAAARTATSVSRIQAEAVPPAGLLLLYVTGAEGSLLFVVPPPPAPVQAFPLGLDASDARALGVPPGELTAAALEATVLGKHGVLSSLLAPAGVAAPTPRGVGGVAAATPGIDPRLATLLRVLLPGPVRDRVFAVDEVVLLPDGPLQSLPFEALVTRPGADASTTRFWLDDGPALRYAPSATFLMELGRTGESRAAASGALSVSNPAYGTSAVAAGAIPFSFDLRGLPPLPGTARETRALRDALGADTRVTVLQGEDAREPAVRRELGGKRFVHLATHGIADRGGNELFAALALAPPPTGTTSPDDDGLLELHEIYALHLDADLAVLSACGSNVGPAVAGEGVFALSRGFLVAGARSVVASQWPVDDDATADLVGRLFRGLASMDRGSRPASTAVALRDAKLGVRHQAGWEHPFFWAPFVLSGLP